MQDACALALTKWPAEGVPSSPRGWLVGVARHKALDLLQESITAGERFREYAQTDEDLTSIRDDPRFPR